jgi:hypothetical protein
MTDMLARLVLILGVVFAIAGYAEPASTKPRVISKLLTPLKIVEEPTNSALLPGKSRVSLSFPASDSDLESQIWKVGEGYNLETKIDVRKVNQATLPVDDYGRITKEAKALTGRPFIKYFLPDGTQKIIDVQCTKVQCRGLWKNFPYREDIPTKYQVEVNIRGLSGRNWRISFNQISVEKGLVVIKPDTRRLEAPDLFESTRLYEKGAFVPPGSAGPREPDCIEEWAFDRAKGLTGTSHHRLGRTTLVEVLQGPLVLDVVRQGEDTLESVELATADRVWLPKDAIVSLKAPRGGKIRRLEFSL